jgi:hypothetical protein
MATMGNSCLFMLDLYAMITLFNFNSDLCEVFPLKIPVWGMATDSL